MSKRSKSSIERRMTAEHGALLDPAIMLVGEGEDKRVAFICPWCSGPGILEQWEKEGDS